MLSHFYIAGVGEGIFWLIIVLFTIIAQIVKATRRSSTAGEQFTKDTLSGSDSPEEELRKFLENLTGVPQSTPPPVPPPTPARQQTVKPKPSPRVQTYARPKPSSPPPVPRTVRKTSHVAARPTVREPQIPKPPPVRVAPIRRPPIAPALRDAYSLQHEAKEGRYRKSVIKQLAQRNSLKEAILLREILGPPLALRNSAGTKHT